MTKSERIAATRKEVDEATGVYHNASLDVERIEKAIAEAVKPYEQPLAQAKANQKHAREQLETAMRRLLVS